MNKKSNRGFSDIEAVENTKVGERKEGIDKVQEYLERFGFLSKSSMAPSTMGLIEDQTSNSLKKYQEFHKLNPTGQFDDATKEQMVKPRCGMPDLIDGIAAVTRCAWNKRDLTYALRNGTNDTPGDIEFQAVKNAFNTFANEVQITFTQVQIDENPDIEIDFGRARCRDNHTMVGGVLAHADFPPGCSIMTQNTPLPLHFDDEEHQWSIGSVPNAFDIETVALHEIGHILGLMHTSVVGAVMFPTVSPNLTLTSLQPDDISGIRSLYP